MVLLRGAVVLALLSGCGPSASNITHTEGTIEAPEAPREAPAEVIAEPAVDQHDEPDEGEAAMVPVIEPSVLEPPLIEPPVSTGPPVVLASRLRVRAGRVPTITLASAGATRDLHDMLESFAAGSRCEVLLATPTLVSVRCGERGRGERGRGERGRDTYYPRSAVFVIDAFGAHPARLLDLFREGTRREDLDAPTEELPETRDEIASSWFAADVALTEEGLETAVLTRELYIGRASRRDYIYRTVGYRAVAPRVRADRALGALLSERGLDVWPQPPEVTTPRGPEVGLRSTLRVRLGAVPTVVLAEPAHTAALHDLMVRYARRREGCSVPIALPSFVSMRCSVRRSGRDGVEFLVSETNYFDIDAAGEPHHVEQDELFHVNMAPTGDLGDWGIEREDGWTTYRSLAPAIRAESGLGRALIERGLILAPVGYQPHVLVDVSRHESLAGIATGFRDADLLPVQVSTSSVDEAWAVMRHLEGGPPGEVMMADDLPPSTAVLELACATDPVQLRDAPDAASPVTGEIVGGSEVVVARGRIGEQVSMFGAGRWIYVAGNPGGWASGRQLLPSYCTVPDDAADE